MRRTKIVATLGPASEQPEVLRELICAGVNVVRLNFSHGSAEEHRMRAERVRSIAEELNSYVAILGDLQGPKIRISRFKDGPITLSIGQDFILDTALGRDEGDATRVGVDYKELAEDCNPGDRLLLDDGRVVLVVDHIEGTQMHCKVEVAGKLSNNKGINREGGGLSAPALTDKDKEDIKTAAAIGVDYVAVSFPRCAGDIEEARRLLQAAGSNAGIVAKIERADAVNDYAVLDQIIIASDAVMVARGDLGVEIGDARLVGVQKHLIARSRTLDRLVITATQMMESMIQSPMPTRAEVMDVANAVLDGTDAVMLSAETAAGAFPIETVKAMSRACLGAEQHPSAYKSRHRMDGTFKRKDEAIAMAAMYTANHLQGVKAIVAITETGSTPHWMSRISSGLPIFALSHNTKPLNKMALYRGVQPLYYDATELSEEEISRGVCEMLVSKGLIGMDDLIILTKGSVMWQQGGTNTMKILSPREAMG
ncbi:pyruvate kinase [Pokkaliibacter sp. CJK22405]|uniref:pyruvate kinase n=1 Tax=Pokkaliibacter sp. CJK22405 TaxID=3384615 RepID=UPI003984C334